MKLPTTTVLMLFLNSVSAKKKTLVEDDHHMIRNLLAKVDAQDAKIAELNEKNAKFEALLLGTHRVPQGKKNLRRGLREDDATVDFATLMDFVTTEEKTEDMIALHGLAHVLKSLIFKMAEMDPFFDCLSYDEVSQTCTLGSNDTNTVDIIAKDDIDVRAVEDGNIKIDSGANVDINAHENVNVTAEGGDINLEAKAQDGTGPTPQAQGGDIIIESEVDIDVVAGAILTLETDDGAITLEAGGTNNDDAVINILAKSNLNLNAGVGEGGGDIALTAFAGTGSTPFGGNVAVNTNGDGDFTVDGSTVLP